jgi:hypothetical protein
MLPIFKTEGAHHMSISQLTNPNISVSTRGSGNFTQEMEIKRSPLGSQRHWTTISVDRVDGLRSRLFCVNARQSAFEMNAKMMRPNASSPPWQDIASAAFDCELELAVIDDAGAHALVFPCRRVAHGWVKADTKEQVTVRPTHWRRWRETA